MALGPGLSGTFRIRSGDIMVDLEEILIMEISALEYSRQIAHKKKKKEYHTCKGLGSKLGNTKPGPSQSRTLAVRWIV